MGVTTITVLVVIIIMLCTSSSISTTFPPSYCLHPHGPGDINYVCSVAKRPDATYQDMITEMENALVEEVPDSFLGTIGTSRGTKGSYVYSRGECFDNGVEKSCKDCLKAAADGLKTYCPGSVGAQFALGDGSCCMRYENYTFDNYY